MTSLNFNKIFQKAVKYINNKISTQFTIGLNVILTFSDSLILVNRILKTGVPNNLDSLSNVYTRSPWRLRCKHVMFPMETVSNDLAAENN